MPETSALLATAAIGFVVGAVLRARLVGLRYRLPDELELARPASWWVIPATTGLTVIAWWALAPGHPLVVPIAYVLAVWTMVPLAFVDLDVQRLPDRIQLPAYPALVLLLTACSLATGEWAPFARALAAGLVLWLLYLALALLPGGGIGFGDVKLAGLLGMLLGWLSWTHVLRATLGTFLIGGVVALAVLVVARRGRRDEFAYGPSMLLGAVCALAAPRLLQGVIS